MQRSRNIFVGQPLERVEDARLLTGRGLFVDDIRPANLLHAAVLRSGVGHGAIVAIDAVAARAAPGVHAVITVAEVGSPVPRIPVRMAAAEGQECFLQTVIAAGKVRFVGEPVALVVAESRAAAEDAMEKISVDIEELPPAADCRASETSGTLLFEEHGTNICTSYVARIGDPDAAFANADYVRREFFQVHRHTALPMETRGLVAEWDKAAGRMTVWGAAKVPFFNRRTLAAMLKLPLESVDLVELDVGGGFGVRGEFYPEDFLIPFAARLVGRPVKWIEDRQEHLLSTNHSRDVACDLEIACRRDGTILALRGQISADMGAYIRTTGIVVPSRAGQFLPGPYRIPNVEVSVKALLTNKTPVGSFRGPGRFEANFFRERMIDMAARDLAIDPVEIREKNLIRRDEMPYDYGTLVPYDSATVYDSGDYQAVFHRCLSEIGWREKAPLQGALIDGRYHGLGLGCFVESAGSGKEAARITLDADGTAVVSIGSSALGQGIETTFAQIAADALGLPMSKIRVQHGSTRLLEQGFGSFHGRSMVMGGPAILDAAEKLLRKVREAAAARFGCEAHEIKLLDGCALGPDGSSIDYFTLSAPSAPLAADGLFESPKRTYSYGTHAAHVAVDPRTGRVEVLDYVGVEDAGRLINPGIVRGQKIGAIVQGLGGVFLDHLVYDDQAQLLTGSLADYLVPTATDFPNVKTVSLEIGQSPMNPLGVKGAGEDGIISVGAAIGNAVAAALAPLGIEPVALPLSPPRLWALIEGTERRPAPLAHDHNM
ncbi:MAG TPA: xanthine dehydrogenase family protein molybdopterin-binding subunit [Pseudolabrys sp.]|nr:xanthine dehydrogenase family protein molybdopterin-binding subunit [Pseudolabrys sp.]